MVWDTILVDGTDILTATRFEEDRDGYYALPPLRGELPTYPGIDGETNTDQPYGPTVFTQHLVLNGASYTGANDEWRTLVKLCKPGQTVTLTKQMSFGTGNESYTALAKLRDIQRARINPVTARCVVEWSILDGVWYGATLTRGLSNGLNTVTLSGEITTKSMTITLTGGTTPTLRNATLDYDLSFSGSMGSAVVIDVLNGTATQSSTDVSEFLTWTRSVPFALGVGTNSIILSGGGSASIDYDPAYP